MSTRWPTRRVVGYLLAVIAIAGGVWMLRGSLVRLAGPPPGRTVSLTGLNRAGVVEVPVINMWKEPGFARDNKVVARIQLPRAGKVDVTLLSQRQAGGLTWDEVSFRDVRGWVLTRFVVE